MNFSIKSTCAQVQRNTAQVKFTISFFMIT